MQRYFEKIKEMFIKIGNIQFASYTKPLITVEDAIEIVNQVAEEFATDTNVGSKDGWIPCKNELPKEYTDVLGCDNNGNIYILQFYKDSVFGNIWRQWNGGLLRLDVILAWQPLPAPYQPKGE